MKFLHALEHLDDLRPCKRKKLRGPSQQIDHRPDLILKTPSVRGQAFIIEIETADRLQDMAKKCREWIWQIKKIIGMSRKRMLRKSLLHAFLRPKACAQSGKSDTGKTVKNIPALPYLFPRFTQNIAATQSLFSAKKRRPHGKSLYHRDDVLLCRLCGVYFVI